MIGKIFLVCGTIALGLMLPMTTYASCVEFMKEAGAAEGVVPRFGKDKKIRALVIYSDAAFLVPKRSLIGKARRKATLKAKREFAEFMKTNLNSESISEEMSEQVEKTDQDGKREAMVEEIDRSLEIIRTNTSAVLSGLIKLDECVDKKEKVVMVAIGWKPSLTEFAADTKQKITKEVKRGDSGSKSTSSGNASEGNSRPTSKITPSSGYRVKSKLKDDF